MLGQVRADGERERDERERERDEKRGSGKQNGAERRMGRVIKPNPRATGRQIKRGEKRREGEGLNKG